mgnify:FL=1
MQLKKDFIVKQVVDDFMLIPVGEQVKNFGGTVELNEVGAFIVNQLKNETTKEKILEAILLEYQVDEATASRDIDATLDKLDKMGLIQ